MNGQLQLFIPNSKKENGLNRGTKWKRNVTNHLNFKNKRFNMPQSNSLQTNEINASIWQVKRLEWSHWSVYSEGHMWLSRVALTPGAGGKGADLAEIQRHHRWKKQKQAHGSDSGSDNTSTSCLSRMSWIWKTGSPSLVRDADAPLSLQMERNSCGSSGSAQGDPALALSRGLVGPVRSLPCTSSWSLLTASNEKVSPFSWRKEARRTRLKS